MWRHRDDREAATVSTTPTKAVPADGRRNSETSSLMATPG
jgi:hypothetical protein